MTAKYNSSYLLHADGCCILVRLCCAYNLYNIQANLARPLLEVNCLQMMLLCFIIRQLISHAWIQICRIITCGLSFELHYSSGHIVAINNYLNYKYLL